MANVLPARYQDASPEVQGMVFVMAHGFFNGDMDAAWRAVLDEEANPSWDIGPTVFEEAELQLRASHAPAASHQ